MKTILVPTDFSSYANKALNYAVSIAKKNKAAIILLHACELIHSPYQDEKTMIEEHNQSIEEESNSRLEALKKTIVETEGLQVINELYDGDVIESILEAARSYQPELIVMGTLGKTGLKNLILGSKTAALLSKTDIPVIAIPHDVEWLEPKKMLLALNDPKVDIALLKPVFDLADLFQSNIQAAIFSDTREEAIGLMEHSRSIHSIQEKLQEVYAGTLVDTVHLSGQDFLDTMEEYISNNHINLLAMITHKRNVVQSLFNRSMTRKMCYHTTVPLLSINTPM